MRPETSVGGFKRLASFCRSERFPLIFALVCAVGSTILTLLGPDRIANMTDLIGSLPIDLKAVRAIAFSLIAIYVSGALLSFLQGRTMAGVTQRVCHRLRAKISAKIDRLPIEFFSRTSTGDILSRVTNDIDAIAQSLNQSLSTLVTSALQILGALGFMLASNVPMALAAVSASLIGFAMMALIMTRSRKYFVSQQENLGKINGFVEEIYSAHSIVKAYNGEKNARDTFAQHNGALKRSGFRAMCLSSLMAPVMVFVGNLGYVAVCVVGGVLALGGKIAIGTIVAFIMYVRYFTQPLSSVAQAMQTLQSAGAAAVRVFDFLNEREQSDGSKKTETLKNVKGLVEFDHIRFGYEDSERIIIRDFSAVARPGQKVAIVGPTGAGKSTLINLLMRFHELKGGEIRIDGVPIDRVRREEVRAQFSMVLQEAWIFEGTLRENLMFCARDADEEKMREACEAVGLGHFVQKHGFDTVLRFGLSQGEKQQITIARAIIANRPMLILDEATASLDTKTELKIQSAMDLLLENRTAFVIAHRLSTIKNADLILVLRGGDVVERGTHEALLTQNGFYAELYRSQFSNR